MSRLNDRISELNSRDTYSLVLFALYKLRDDPKYASLSELVYILDEHSMLRLCEYYGGMTLKIPTVEEMESVVKALLVYYKVDILGESYEEVIDNIHLQGNKLSHIKADYERISEMLPQYDFNRGEINEY